LQFVTGTCRVPVGGFAELMGKLQRDKILLKMIIDIILFHFINMGLTLMSINTLPLCGYLEYPLWISYTISRK